MIRQQLGSQIACPHLEHRAQYRQNYDREDRYDNARSSQYLRLGARGSWQRTMTMRSGQRQRASWWRLLSAVPETGVWWFGEPEVGDVEDSEWRPRRRKLSRPSCSVQGDRRVNDGEVIRRSVSGDGSMDVGM